MPQITIREDMDGPVPDSHMDSRNPTNAHGSDTTFRVGFVGGIPPTVLRAILNFPLSAVPAGVNINAATLRLYCQTAAASDEPAKVRRITRSDWDELFVTWNRYKSLSPWTSPGGDFDATDEADFLLPLATGDQDIDILALVRDAIDKRSNQLHILLMRATESTFSGAAIYRSGEHATAGDRPELIVDYDYADRMEPMNKLRSRIPVVRRRPPIVGTVL